MVTIEVVDVFFAVASELAILKEKIERRESGGPGPDLPAPGSATLGADKISQLTVEVRSLRRRVSEVQDEADELRRAKQELETRIRGIENERDAAVKQSSQVLGWYLVWLGRYKEECGTPVVPLFVQGNWLCIKLNFSYGIVLGMLHCADELLPWASQQETRNEYIE